MDRNGFLENYFSKIPKDSQVAHHLNANELSLISDQTYDTNESELNLIETLAPPL